MWQSQESFAPLETGLNALHEHYHFVCFSIIWEFNEVGTLNFPLLKLTNLLLLLAKACCHSIITWKTCSCLNRRGPALTITKRLNSDCSCLQLPTINNVQYYHYHFFCICTTTMPACWLLVRIIF